MNYLNPLRGITGLTAERIDQGVDYAGSGPLYALGNGKVLNTRNSGWPGGAFISFRLADGPFAGKIVYYAENIIPAVSVGQVVTPNTVVGTLVNAYPNSELGWAAEPGTGESLARASGQVAPAGDPGNVSSAYGKNFSDLLFSLGAPAGIMQGSVIGSLPSSWPAITPTPGGTMNLTLNGNPVPGTWASANIYKAAGGKYVCVGTGTDGNVYAQESADGGVSWTRVVGNWPF